MASDACSKFWGVPVKAGCQRSPTVRRMYSAATGQRS